MTDIGYTLTLPKVQPIDNNGLIMPGAKLYTYLAGTTTPVDSFTDAALTTPHTNPVLADSNGRFPPIFLSHSVIYKLDVTDSDDVSLSGYPVDNYRMSNQLAKPQAYSMHYADLDGWVGSTTNGVPYFVNQIYDTIDGSVATVTNDSTDGLTITATERILLMVSYSCRVNATGNSAYTNGLITFNYPSTGYPSTDSFKLAEQRSEVDNTDVASFCATASVILEIGDVVKPQTQSNNVDTDYDGLIWMGSAIVIS